MNQSLLLHVVERLEGLVGKLPATIQRPILSELTPLKELFLRQRPPRFLFTGSSKTPLAEILLTLFPGAALDTARGTSIENRWQDVHIPNRGAMSILDVRTVGAALGSEVEDELDRQYADIVFFVTEGESARGPRKASLDNLIGCIAANDKRQPDTKVFAVVVAAAKSGSATGDHAAGLHTDTKTKVESFLESNGMAEGRFAGAFRLAGERERQTILTALARELPNEARIEMARLSDNREAQADIAQLLVKSTTAICTAVGTQPIPLADLPILTTLQLVMVSGIMYISGRERSLRAATEFVAALGANVGAGMLLREGTRAILKFFPGWGNLVCGMVAGAGTYAIGRAATVFFVEGVSLKDARRTYLASRRKPARPKLLGGKRTAKKRTRAK